MVHGCTPLAVLRSPLGDSHYNTRLIKLDTGLQLHRQDEALLPQAIWRLDALQSML